jgi:hypothetical protein
MTAIDVAEDLLRRGIDARVRGGMIELWPPERVTTAVVAAVRAVKPDLLQLLATDAPAPSDEEVGWRVSAMLAQIPAVGQSAAS